MEITRTKILPFDNTSEERQLIEKNVHIQNSISFTTDGMFPAAGRLDGIVETDIKQLILLQMLYFISFFIRMSCSTNNIHI